MIVKPKITVITVCLNSVTTITKTLNSVLNQSYNNIEYIVIDGGSTDGTLDILQSYESKIDILISEPDDGLYFALNKGIGIASGEIISILHSDDYFYDENVIEDVENRFQNNTQIEAVITNLQVANQKTGQIVRNISSGGFKTWHLVLGLMPAHCATFLKREVYDRHGVFDVRYPIAADFDFFVRIFLGYNTKYIAFDRMTIDMKTGGLSSRGLTSYFLISKEILSILKYHRHGWIRYLSVIRGLVKLVQLRLN